MPKWLKWFLAGSVCAIVTAYFVPTIFHGGGTRRNAERAACQSNLKRIGLALAQYSADYDERLPPVVLSSEASSTAPFSKPYGWADASHSYWIQSYQKSTRIYQCPSEQTKTEGTDGVQTGFTDYWMNANLSGIATKNVKHPATTLLCGDGNDARKLQTHVTD